MSKKVIVLDSLFVILLLCDLLIPMMINPLMEKYDWWSEFYGMYLFPSLFILLAFEVVMMFVTLVAVILGIKNRKKCSAKKVYGHALAQVLMRFIQIPAYVIIFYIAFIAIFGVFTIPITILLAVVDVISIALTGFCSIAVYAEMQNKGFITGTEQGIYTVCAFIYCLDVLVALIAFIRAFIYKHRIGLEPAV